MQRIVWSEAPYAGAYGRIGGFKLFSISWTTMRDDPEPWKLRTELPVSLAKVKTDFAELEEAKAKAERVMTSFIQKLGAKWIED